MKNKQTNKYIPYSTQNLKGRTFSLFFSFFFFSFIEIIVINRFLLDWSDHLNCICFEAREHNLII